MLMVATFVSKAGCDLGKVTQKVPSSIHCPQQGDPPVLGDRPEHASLHTLPFNNRYCQETGDNSRRVQGLLGHA